MVHGKCQFRKIAIFCKACCILQFVDRSRRKITFVISSHWHSLLFTDAGSVTQSMSATTSAPKRKAAKGQAAKALDAVSATAMAIEQEQAELAALEVVDMILTRGGKLLFEHFIEAKAQQVTTTETMENILQAVEVSKHFLAALFIFCCAAAISASRHGRELARQRSCARKIEVRTTIS